MKARFTRGARNQLQAISDYIRERNPKAALRVGQRLKEVVHLLTEQPAIGIPGRVPDTREFQVPGLPYRIIYRVARHQGIPVLEVLRVHHGAQAFTPPGVE